MYKTRLKLWIAFVIIIYTGYQQCIHTYMMHVHILNKVWITSCHYYLVNQNFLYHQHNCSGMQEVNITSLNYVYTYFVLAYALVIYQTPLKQVSLPFLCCSLIQMVVTCMNWKLKRVILRVMKVCTGVHVQLHIHTVFIKCVMYVVTHFV